MTTPGAVSSSENPPGANPPNAVALRDSPHGVAALARWSALAEWCEARLGPVEYLDVFSKEHKGHESSVRRMRTPRGVGYLKVHESREHWNNEVHAYERWAPAFGALAPRLWAVRDAEPLALVLSEVVGTPADSVELSPIQARELWRAAGAALPALHNLGSDSSKAKDRIAERCMGQLERARAGAYIDTEEATILKRIYASIPAFEGESFVPCHRDYCAANWLVDAQGTLTGIIDFEFSQWDIRMADFSRDPDWNWIRRPDLFEAFLKGYGRPLSPREQEQLLVARAEYALGAILWGRDSDYRGFEREGRDALRHLTSSLDCGLAAARPDVV